MVFGIRQKKGGQKAIILFFFLIIKGVVNNIQKSKLKIRKTVK